MTSTYERFENEAENDAKPPPYSPPPNVDVTANQGGHIPQGYPVANQQGYAPPNNQQGYPQAPPNNQQGYPQAYAGQQQNYPSGPQGPPGQQGYPGAQPGYPGPPPAFPPGRGQGVPPQQGGQPVVLRESTVVVAAIGNCPKCRAGNMRETVNICAIILAVLFFPLGLLFLLCMRDNKCDRCGYIE